MKKKRYEETFIIFFFIFIIFINLIILFSYSFNKKIITYELINASYVKDDLIQILVTDKQLKNIYKNKYLFINNRKRKIRIEKVDKYILKRYKKSYHSVLLNVELDKKYKNNDLIELFFFKEKINVYSMIKVVWKGV